MKGGLLFKTLKASFKHSFSKSLVPKDYGYRQGDHINWKFRPHVKKYEEFTVEFNSHRAYTLNLKKDENVSFVIDVHQGLPIDIFLLDETEYVKYIRWEDFQYYKEYSALDTRSHKMTIKMDMDRHIVLVIDNTTHPEGKAAPDIKYKKGTAIIHFGYGCEQATVDRINSLDV